jgi:IstB-like ATP binding protein
MPYPDFLRGLLQEELLAREDNQLRRRLKEATFPFEKTMDDFDFRLRPELNRQLFLRYLDDRFVTQGRSLCLIGPTGVGNRRVFITGGPPPRLDPGITQEVAPNERQRAPSALASEALIHEALFVAFRLQCRFKKGS